MRASEEMVARHIGNNRVYRGVHRTTGTAHVARPVKRFQVDWTGEHANLPSSEALQQFFVAHPLLGVRDAADELSFVRSKRCHTSSNCSIKVYAQVYNHISVFGGEMRVRINGNGDIVEARGHFVPNIAVDTHPTISAHDAANFGHAFVAKSGYAHY